MLGKSVRVNNLRCGQLKAEQMCTYIGQKKNIVFNQKLNKD